MKIQVRKWLIVVTTLFSLMFVVVGLEAKKGGKPGNPGDTSGEAAALNCELANDADDTVLSDDYGPYMDGVDKVGCGHSGTNSTYGIQLNTVSKGAIKRAIRKIDLAFGYCIQDYDCESIPPDFLNKATNPDDMEDVWIGTGPYPDMEHISLLGQGLHDLKFHMSPQGLADRYVVQLMSSDKFPSDLGTGGWCNLKNNLELDWYNDAKTMEDMTVCIWPDGNDADSRPDGYTITTGDIIEAHCPETSPMETPPVVTPRFREATICSTFGDSACDGDMCNVLGTVPLQFTLHATYQ
jgi:hypothetical protein